VSPDKAAIAHLALERLILRLGEHHDPEPEELWASHRLIVRESTVGTPA
jgi:DNA-binding LacI/PurR family transcriptional regulator